jgi:hypothetical protein
MTVVATGHGNSRWIWTLRAGGAIVSQTLYGKHEPCCLVNIICFLTLQTVPLVLDRVRSFPSASLWQELLLSFFNAQKPSETFTCSSETYGIICRCLDFYGGGGGTRWRSWLRHCATSRKVAGSTPDGITGIFYWHNPSGRTMVVGLTQPLAEMITRNISWRAKAAGA